jgi:integrase
MLQNLYTKNGAWHVRYRQGGRRLSKRLGSVEDYLREKDIASLYHDFMRDHSLQKAKPTTPNQTLREFVTTSFFYYIERKKKPSTVKGYKQVWNAYLDSTLGDLKLPKFSRSDARLTLEKLQATHARNTVQNCKIMLSSAFKRALALDLVEANPIHDLVLEEDSDYSLGQKDSLDGPRYSIAELERVLPLLKPRERALLAAMFYAALRPGEAAALTWQAYNGVTLNITQAVWEGEVGSPKTKGSVAAVPVIAPLRQILDEYKPKTAGLSWMFPGATGKPIRTSALGSRIMRPAFQRAGVEWRGFYALRRGATDYLLLDMQLDFDEVRTILRHDPKSKVLEKHYAAEAARRGVQQRIALAVGKKIDAAFALRVAEQVARASATIN